MKSEMNMCQTVVCTCILHKICILQNDRLDDIMNVDPDDGDGQGNKMDIHGFRMMPREH